MKQKKKSMRVISKSFFFLWTSTETEAPSSSSLLSYALLLDSEPLSGPGPLVLNGEKHTVTKSLI